MTLERRPITLREARRFVGEHHRHSPVSKRGWLTGVGAVVGDELVGVAILGRPDSRMLQDGYTAQIDRCCTNGYRNACSFLYGSLATAATGLGYRLVISYTQEDEDGASLRAAGFVLRATSSGGEWSRPSRPRAEDTLFGPRERPGPVSRWERRIGKAVREAVA